MHCYYMMYIKKIMHHVMTFDILKLKHYLLNAFSFFEKKMLQCRIH